jgi:hypothetical protein
VQKLTQNALNFPQIIKLQDTINYNTLKKYLQNYDPKGLSDNDWNVLDYLLTNMLWFSAGNGIVESG